MASIVRQANGRRLIQFVGPDRTRHSIRLGMVSQRMAEAFKVRVEALLGAAMTGHVVDEETALWLNRLDAIMKDRLAGVGLIPQAEVATLQSFIDHYLKTRCDAKPSTHFVFRHTRRNLIDFFGPNKKLKDITPGDADEWRLYLHKQDLAENTIRRRCGIAKQYLNAAIRKGLVTKNPFSGLKAAVVANTKRMYFVSRTEAQRVLDACPDAEWRLIFALCRYGGLRCPSEHMKLTWNDINWERGRITIHSPKTEHHPGQASRQIPIFPELQPYLREVFEAAEPGTTYVINRNRSFNWNLRTRLYKIIRRAGLQPWPKLFHNLRSTRETELAERYPLHVVCTWIGNSQPIAAKHYLQITDEHFTQAAAPIANAKPNTPNTACSALQNAMQQATA
jgi:integrase